MLSARDHPICKARTWYTWRFPSRLRAATVREGADRVFGRTFGRSGLQGKWNGARHRDDHERVKTARIEISVRRNDKAVGFLISSSSGRLMPALPLGISNASEVGRRDAMGQAARRWHHRRCVNRWSAPMPQPNDLSRSLVALDQDSTIIAVVEMSQSSWLVAGMLPGIERQPRKKLEPSPERLLGLLHRWRDEAVKAGRKITRIALAFEAGRDGFWLARWLEAHGVEAHVIHPSSVAVSREHRRAKTDRLDTELLKRGFLGWLRGERGHCTMARVPTIAEEDAKRPNRERECLVGERTRIVNRMKGTLARLGIRNFKPTLRKAAERLATLHTPEGSVLPPNVSAELQRNMARLGF